MFLGPPRFSDAGGCLRLGGWEPSGRRRVVAGGGSLAFEMQEARVLDSTAMAGASK